MYLKAEVLLLTLGTYIIQGLTSAAYRLKLEDSTAEASTPTVWNSTDPTNSVFSIGTSNSVTQNNHNYIAYCWTATAGVSAFGSYSGASGETAITGLGFKPAFVMIKRKTGGTGNWCFYDNTRNTVNPADLQLFPDTTGAENTSTNNKLDFDSDGFTLKGDGGTTNVSGSTYVYAAFADTRSAAFWLDQSSNNNDWQPENLDYMDSLSDSPTTNYPTLNPLSVASQTLSNGNLQVVGSTTAWSHVRSTQSPLTGKWYCEVDILFENAGASDRIGVGVANADAFSQQNIEPSEYLGETADSWSYFENGQVWNNGANTGTVTSYDAGDVIGMALDLDSSPQTITWYKNGTQIVQKDLALGTALTGRWTFGVTTYHIGEGLINFGQQPFLYTPPSGYEALNTTNMPDPVIDPSGGEEARDYFETFIYTGNGSGLQVGDVIREPAVTGIIDKSLIWDDGTTSYISGTSGSADTTYTVSMWFRRANNPTAFMYLYSSGSNGFAIDNDEDRFYIYNGSVSSFMGPAIKDNFWHHVVYSQSSGSFTLHLDGIQIGTGTGFTLSTTSGATHIGHYAGSGDLTFDGYIADVNFVSGTALNATSFGAFDANGIWSPIEPSVTYGSSGYRLQFEDGTSTTTLGNDTSGNNNDFTLNNMATTDQVPDSPTNAFMILNSSYQRGTNTFSDGNLNVIIAAGSNNSIVSHRLPRTGKHYFEFELDATQGSAVTVGLVDATIASGSLTHYAGTVTSDITQVMAVCMSIRQQSLMAPLMPQGTSLEWR